MKNLLLILTLLSSCFTFGQATTNQSLGTVNTNITNPVGIQSGEIFRFRAGNVRQLDAGSNFTFNNSRWFSLGRVNTGSQSVYGLRFQLPNKSITLGYQDINSANPRIQWIGTGSSLGDLEFRVANSFTSTNSTLVATMTSEGRTLFGKVRTISSFFDPPLAQVEIDNTASAGATSTTGLRVFTSRFPSSATSARGIDVRTYSGSSQNLGGYYQTQGGNSATGLFIDTRGNTESMGIRSSTRGGSNNNIAVMGITSLSFAFTGFSAAIYGDGNSSGSASGFAGFFDGDVFTTGSYLPSDRKLKDNIVEETKVLDRLALLRPVTYDYKEMSEIKLSTQKQHGFISQEFAEVFPELTKDITKPVFDKEGEVKSNYSLKAINYTGLISVLTSAVNELNGEVQLLKEELADLKNERPSEKTSNGSLFEDSSKPVLEQNVPNPFADQTTIRYQLTNASKSASLMVFSLSGTIVKEFSLRESNGEITISASQIGKGMFIYSLVENGQELISKKMVIK